MIEHNFLKPQKFLAGARFELCHIRRDEGWSQWSQHRIVIGLRDTSKLMKSGHQFGICIVQSFNAPLLGFNHLLLLFHNALHFFLVMAKLIFNIHQPIKSILNSIKSNTIFQVNINRLIIYFFLSRANAKGMPRTLSFFMQRINIVDIKHILKQELYNMQAIFSCYLGNT